MARSGSSMAGSRSRVGRYVRQQQTTNRTTTVPLSRLFARAQQVQKGMRIQKQGLFEKTPGIKESERWEEGGGGARARIQLEGW